jgi:hypothetical protein
MDGWNQASNSQLRNSFSEYRFVRPDGSVAWAMEQYRNEILK